MNFLLKEWVKDNSAIFKDGTNKVMVQDKEYLKELKDKYKDTENGPKIIYKLWEAHRKKIQG